MKELSIEDKELLLKDLCARLPYGVMIQYPELFRPSILVTEKLEEYYKGHFGSDGNSIEFVKPYLRPLSSMTEEEIRELNNIPSTKNYEIVKGDLPWDLVNYKQMDWLNAHHFDYCGLIEKGLAIEVTNEHNPYKK